VTGKLHYVQNKHICTIKITQYAPAINYSNVCLHTHVIIFKFSFVSRNMRFIRQICDILCNW